MANAKKFKLIVLLIVAISTFLTAVVATYTWYTNQNIVDTNNAPVKSTTTPSLFAGFPDGEMNEEKYYGQTGIQYNGEDSPYILEYNPITIKPQGLDAKLRYLTAGIEGVKITLSGKDEFGHPIEEIYLLNDEIGIQMLSHFTFRMNLTYYNNGTTDIQVGEPYKNENGYIVNEITNQPLLLETNYSYYFDLLIVFQSEEGYQKLLSTQADISSSYIFPLSNQKYMFSNIRISFNFGLSELMRVNLNANGGECDTEYLPTTGKGILAGLNDIIPTRENYTFNGWYYNATATNPFLYNSLVTSPIPNDITIYAGWTAKPKITFNYNLAGYNPATSIEYIVSGEKILEPVDPVYGGYVFIGWSESADTTYDNFDTYKYDFETTVTADKTLYAVWRARYAVTFIIPEAGSPVLNGKLTQVVDGVGTIVSTTTYVLYVYEGETIASYFDNTKDTYFVIETTETFGDKHFKWWSTTVSKQGVTYSDAPTYNTSQPQNSDVTLYAFYNRVFG